MSWYYRGYFKPYVSVAQKRARAEREIARRKKKGDTVSPVIIEGSAIADTFWGKAWCNNLESYSDYSNRLPRGRSYVRNGSVVHLEIKPGEIVANVSGSSLYDVKIKITELAGPCWKAVKAQCAGQIGSLVELLQGRLSKHVMEVVTRRNEGLFPRPAEIKMSCSCPDSAGVCKHIAAVMYGVGSRLDQQPELLFRLRKVDHLELIQAAGQPVAMGKPAQGKNTGKKKKTIAADDLAGVFGIELAEAAPAEPPALPATVVEQGKPAAVRRARSAAAGAQSGPRTRKTIEKVARAATTSKVAAQSTPNGTLVDGATRAAKKKPRRAGSAKRSKPRKLKLKLTPVARRTRG